MSLLSTDQLEGIPTTLLLDSLPAVNASVLNVIEETIDPSNTLSYNSKRIDFKVQSSNEFIDTRGLRLHIELSIKKREPNSSEWQDLEPTDRCSLINSIATSLWSDINVTLNDQKISVDDSQFHYKAYLRTLTTCNKQTCEDKLKYLNGFYKDTCGYFHDVSADTTKISGQAGLADSLNEAFDLRRSGIFEGNKKLTYTTNLNFIDIASFSKYLPPGVTLKLTLTRNSDQFCLMSDKDDSNLYAIHLYKVELKVPIVKTSNAISVSHTQVMDKHPLLIPIQRTELRSITIPEGLTVWKKSNLFQVIPQIIIIGFCDPDAHAGLTYLNPMEFKPYNLKSVKLKVGTEVISPTLEFTNSSSENYLQGYLSLYQFNNNLTSQHVLPMSLEEYKRGYFFLAFNLSNTYSTQVGSNLLHKKNLSLEINFHDGQRDTINGGLMLMVYSESERLVRISKGRSVFYMDF